MSNKELTERVRELERRVKELENRQQQTWMPTPQWIPVPWPVPIPPFDPYVSPNITRLVDCLDD